MFVYKFLKFFIIFFLFLAKRKIKLSVVCKKDHQNRRNGSGDIVLRKRKTIKFFRLFKAFFRPLRTQMAHNFHFFALFAISDNKRRVWYIIRHINCAYKVNQKNFIPFCSIAHFPEIGYQEKQSSQIKKTMRFSASRRENSFVPVWFFIFWGPTSILQRKKKIF